VAASARAVLMGTGFLLWGTDGVLIRINELECRVRRQDVDAAWRGRGAGFGGMELRAQHAGADLHDF
jgi:hypothetical protein